MAEDNAEGLPAEETSEAEEHVYDTVISFDKAEQKQRLAVEELVHTEASYVQNLQLCISDIHNNLQKKQLPEIDLEGLFSNVDDVLCVSKHLLKGLEAAMNHEDEQLLRISTLFQEMKEEMENVYKIYCGDYDQALLLLDIYRKDPRLQKEIADTLSATVPHTGASDLSFFLVMPVQRITKYPLLLQKILENTPDTDSAYRAVQAAATAMADVNANINEYKRRKEVANKYNKPGYLTLRERLARLNTHSIAKKTTRLSRLFMHEAGIVPKTEDKEFDELEERFQCLVSAVTELKENVASFLNNTEAFLSFKPHQNEMEIGGTDQQYSNFSGKLHSIVFPVYKDRLECLVYRPLCNLSETLKGPQKLIRKRVDKLLDYEEIEDKRNETGSVTYEEETAINTYLAINSLLVSELPVFNQVTLQWLQHILRTFAAIQRDLAQAVLQEADRENGQLPHRHLSAADFWKMVKDTFSQAENQLSSFQRKFETVMPSPVAQSLSPAEERKVLSLVSKHGAEKLYQVISNVSGSRDMDLTLQRGQIVALLQDKDTKGNANRWLVDAGGPRGYVPPGKLQPYHHVARNEKPRVQMVASDGGAEKINHAYSLPQTPSLPVPFRTPTLQVVAGYPFAARSTHEVSLQAGQPVTVLEPHDKKGSKEWSLVEVNGQRGYVPSSYLVMVPVPEPPGWSAPIWSHQTQETSS